MAGVNRFKAYARLPKGKMNKLETDYARLLEIQKQAGEIVHYEFEPEKFRLAGNTFYTPDFLVITASRKIEYHETKGFWEDDARVKIKVAANKFWWVSFIGVTKKKGKWEHERFGLHD